MRAFGATVLLVACGTAVAAVVPPAGAVDPRVREIEFREGQVVSITGYVGYHIDLELEPGEQFVALGAGDSAGVDVAAQGSHVLVKPKAARVATNLTLISSRRVYHFEYRSYEAQPPEMSAIFALRFRYPVAPSGVTPAATSQPFSSSAPPPAATVAEWEAVTPPAPARAVNAEYWYCGSPWLKPNAASDDGVQTRLTFSSRGEWPAIFVANPDGSESLANFHAEGTTAVVHRVAGKFVLRRGQLVGCVENRGYAGSGDWVENGTLDPGESREVAR
jgi:type IV secretion system protein VirB9